MESFLRRKLARASGNILGGSSLQKPVSSYQIKLPELSSSFYSIADEPFPQVSGFLDETVSPSFISNDASVLNTPACAQSDNKTKNKDKGITNDSGLNCSFGAHSQSAGRSTSTLQNDKDISATAGKTNADTAASLQSSTFLEKSDLMSIDLKNCTFDLTQDLKEPSDPVVSETVDLQGIKEKNSTFDLTQDLKECPNTDTNVTVDLQDLKEKNSTIDLTQELKELSDQVSNATVDLQNIKEKSCTFDLTQDLKVISEAGVDLQNFKEKNSTIDLTQDLKKTPDACINDNADLQNIKEKNGTFDLTKELNKTPDACINMNVDLQNMKKINSTFDLTQESGKTPDACINVHADLQNIKEKNNTFDLTHDSKEQSESGSNATVDLQNISEKNSTFDVGQDSKEQSDTGVNNATVDLHTIKEKNSTFESQEPKEGPDTRINSTVDIDVPNTKTESGNTTVELVRSHDSKEAPDSGVNASVDIPNVESVHSKTDSPFVNSSPLNTTTEQPKEKLKGTVDIQQQEKLDGSLNSNEEDKIKNTEANLKINVTIEEEQMGSAPLQQSGDISRNSVFCLDDSLHMKTSFMFTSTPIVFGKELSRFDILRDKRATPMRNRLSVINSMEAQSNDELTGASNHEGTEAMQATERSDQKVSTNCTSSRSTSEPANENKPPMKPPMKRRLPQLSSKLSYPKSSLPPRPYLSNDSSVAVKPKTIRGPQTLHPPNTLSTSQFGIKKTIQMNKGKNLAPVKNAAPASTVKTSAISSVTGYNFTAVAKPSSSAIPQVKPSGLQPPTRKRALKTPQSTQSSVETIQTQHNNKPTVLPGMRTRNSQLPSVGQKRMSNDGLPSAKRKRIVAAAPCTVGSDAVHPAEGAHESGCGNCLQHQERLERVRQELMVLRSECTNWGPLHEKLVMFVEEMKRF